MLYGLALQKNASQIFLKTNKRGIPIYAVLASGALTFLVVPLNYIVPNWFDAFKIVISFVIICILITWTIIILSHLKFKQKNKETLFPAPFYPYSNYIALAFIVFILIVMALPQTGMTKQLIAIPVWIFIVYIIYKILKKEES
jgi:L-asparagine transporter-like permease